MAVTRRNTESVVGHVQRLGFFGGLASKRAGRALNVRTMSLLYVQCWFDAFNGCDVITESCWNLIWRELNLGHCC